MKITGRASTFGGPKDTGVSPSEGLALLSFHDLHDPEFAALFLSAQPPGTSGLARRLNPSSLYCAMRWDYKKVPPSILRHSHVMVVANGITVSVCPVDWGPNIRTGRIIDLSPGAATRLGIHTDSVVTAELILPT